MRVLGQVSDDELDALYRGALALVVPSLLEGYGLPLREALARGMPAVVSDLPVFGPELSPAVLRVAGRRRRARGGAAADRQAEGSGTAWRRREATVDGLTWEAAARGPGTCSRRSLRAERQRLIEEEGWGRGRRREGRIARIAPIRG